MQDQSGIAFIIDPIDVTGALPVELIEGHVFRHATEGEVALLKSHFREGDFIDAQLRWHLHENDQVARAQAQQTTTWESVPLPRERWRYWVITYEGGNGRLARLSLPFLLLKTDFQVGYEIFFSRPSQGGESRGFLTHGAVVEGRRTPGRGLRDVRTLDATELLNVREYQRLCSQVLDEECSFIKTAMQNYMNLEHLPALSDMLVVGYVAVIEALITHKPRRAETLDSIGHQVRNKMVLLGKRFGRRISHTEFFSEIELGTMWDKLYGFRSEIVHGMHPTFDGVFQILSSKDAVISYLRDNVKELILTALREPSFVIDLKRC
jgi:hypothetical protein